MRARSRRDTAEADGLRRGPPDAADERCPRCLGQSSCCCWSFAPAPLLRTGSSPQGCPGPSAPWTWNPIARPPLHGSEWCPGYCSAWNPGEHPEQVTHHDVVRAGGGRFWFVGLQHCRWRQTGKQKQLPGDESEDAGTRVTKAASSGDLMIGFTVGAVARSLGSAEAAATSGRRARRWRSGARSKPQ